MNIDWAKVLKYLGYASYGLNVFVFGKWLETKLKQSKFLSGRWEGTLICDHSASGFNKDIRLECILVITNHIKRDNNAIFYYESINSSSPNYVGRGMDKIIEDDSSFFFAFKRKWNPRFVRVIHTDERRNPNEILSDKAYFWECNIPDLSHYWVKERMAIKIKGDDICFSGYLQKF